MKTASDKQIILERILNAPRELVYDAFTNPKHVSNWWGPNGFATTTKSMEVKVGGAWIYDMLGPDGTNYPNHMDFVEVIKNEKLVFKLGTGVANDPDEFMGYITFEDIGGKTKLTMITEFKTAADKDRAIKLVGAIEGGQQTINRLEEYLKTM